MSPPGRETTAGRAYLDLRARARREGRPTDELIVLYVLERFLFRLGRSDHRDRLVLKGGMLLAVFEERRPTGDVDLLARSTANEVDTIAAIVREVASVEVDDGVRYEPDQLRSERIRETDAYAGVRLTMPARLDRARHPLRIDVSVGDPVTPRPVEVEFPSLLEGPFRIIGYPLETVLAEKIVTMIERGDTTTRERDFADVYVLTRSREVVGTELAAALRATADHRGVELRSLRSVLELLGTARQSDWTRFVRRSGLDTAVPTTYQAAIDAIADFADPLLTGEVSAAVWHPLSGRWA
jgi:predicted nucleotidyltransferase component of viral defense system